MPLVKTDLYLGDCREQLTKLLPCSVDLVITSPPYADQRKHLYGGPSPDKYVEWFLPISQQLWRVLKPTGTFILNIKERVVQGERSGYVLELILALRQQGWKWTEEFIWHKTTSYPGKWPNRFRDAWERLLQFNKQTQFTMYQNAVMVPIGGWHEPRFRQRSPRDHIRTVNQTGSLLSRRHANWETRTHVYPTNVLHLPTVCSNTQHGAAFPESIPAWFIALFTAPADSVLDPFMGSGTTIVTAKKMNRHSIGIELVPGYYDLAKRRANMR